ncbi:alcohol dehydrogenase catalytic domain-containing protein [Krasilnikoviella flava]|uniref:NADPH:quinone reductase n=1 Tax=Krasilnikoviella flava TaxID=526729 RepID=A0A1T5L5Z7_9MICO|nr:zinc-binding dehydrogenase [Krasilnikoviella flava]SKC71363.1 NADPH:quinone reductase [Krasilnikoviella flava]
MDAIRHHSFGPPETLVLEQVPDPEPGPGQVLVAARAHGVHLLDTTLRRGEDSGPLPLPALPAIPGREVAGTVVAVGPDVDGSWLGARVAAHLGAIPDGGGYARLAAAPVGSLHRLPERLGLAEAVAMIGTGRMALMTLEVAQPGPDDVVVLTAAAGGLGSLFVQSALGAGARVLALAGGPRKVRAVRGLVPDAGHRVAVVDVDAPGWPADARTALGRLHAGAATILIDGVGGELGAEAAALLGPGGRLVVQGWASGLPNPVAASAVTPDGDPVEVRAVVGPGGPRFGDLREYQRRALERAASGSWRVLTHRVAFAEAARAHRELEERRTVGKVVLG